MAFGLYIFKLISFFFSCYWFSEVIIYARREYEINVIYVYYMFAFMGLTLFMNYLIDRGF